MGDDPPHPLIFFEPKLNADSPPNLSLVCTAAMSSIHCPPSSPVINLVGAIEGSLSNLHCRRWLGWWISKSFDIHRPSSSPNHMSFFYVGKDVRIKYASSNFSLFLCYMEKHFSLGKMLMNFFIRQKASYNFNNVLHRVFTCFWPQKWLGISYSWM